MQSLKLKIGKLLNSKNTGSCPKLSSAHQEMQWSLNFRVSMSKENNLSHSRVSSSSSRFLDLLLEDLGILSRMLSRISLKKNWTLKLLQKATELII